MVDEESVEEIDIIRLYGREVEVFVEIRSAAIDHSQSSLALGIHALKDMWYEAGEVLGNSIVGTE